ncbi:MAG: Gfo/Idh/MocA family oxidoreductase [Oscillospiraceae bacterium]|nr:Gfo/Idh/MocA family oxidoreductase [Oscillospiraceae bacterium]
MTHLRIGIIGIGNMGFAHATCIAQNEINGMVLTAVCDINNEKTASFVEKYPKVRQYSDYNEMFDSGTIDAVVIAVPHPLHAKIAMVALKKNLHVLLEKPADISISKVAALNKVAKASKATFGIMFNQRTNPLFRKAREIVASGELGSLKRSVWIVTNWYRTQSYYDSGEWRATWIGEGGGVLLNQAPHNLDLWQWICGMPQSITAFCDVSKYHNIEVEDDATIFARYDNGATGTFITSTGEYPGTNRLEISGTLGKLVLENGTLKWWKLKHDEREICKTSKENSTDIEFDYYEITPSEPETAHKGILQNFANSVLNGEELIAPGTDGLFELTISNAAYLSSWNGSKEIKLPFDSKAFDKKLAKLAKNSKIKQSKQIKNDHNGYSARWSVRW